MIRCVAIDDEPRALQVVRSHAEKVPFLDLCQTFVDPFKAIEFVNQEKIELVFLDINMPEIDGLALMRSFQHQPLIIFTTAHGEHAIDGFEVAAIDYLLKPFDFPRFLQAVTRVQDRLFPKTAETRDFFFVTSGHQKKRLFYHDVLLIEGEGNYVNYRTAAGNTLVRASIRETLINLPSTQFIQIHRSFIVALAHIEKVEDNHVFIGQQRISIGATYRDAFHKRLENL